MTMKVTILQSNEKKTWNITYTNLNRHFVVFMYDYYIFSFWKWLWNSHDKIYYVLVSISNNTNLPLPIHPFSPSITRCPVHLFDLDVLCIASLNQPYRGQDRQTDRHTDIQITMLRLFASSDIFSRPARRVRRGQLPLSPSALLGLPIRVSEQNYVYMMAMRLRLFDWHVCACDRWADKR